MTEQTLRYTALVLGLVAMVACGGDAAESAATKEPETPAEAMQQMQAAMQEMAKAQESGGPLVPAATLQERLPESVAGMPRVDSERTQGGAMGFNVSSATARYEADGGARQVSITITDVGGAGMLAAVGAAWAMADLDRETSNGFERTTRVDGYRAFEQEERSGDHVDRSLSVLVNDRLVVQLEGDNVSLDDLRRAFSQMRLGSLAPGK